MHEAPELGVLLSANYSHEEGMAGEQTGGGVLYLASSTHLCSDVIQNHTSVLWELWQCGWPASARLWTL